MLLLSDVLVLRVQSINQSHTKSKTPVINRCCAAVWRPRKAWRRLHDERVSQHVLLLTTTRLDSLVRCRHLRKQRTWLLAAVVIVISSGVL